MVKDNMIPKIEEVRNLEEHGNKLMEKIMENTVDWTINSDGNYQNDEIGEIINVNNFISEQNQKIKNRLEFREMVKQRGRAGKVKRGSKRG